MKQSLPTGGAPIFSSRDTDFNNIFNLSYPITKRFESHRILITSYPAVIPVSGRMGPPWAAVGKRILHSKAGNGSGEALGISAI